MITYRAMKKPPAPTRLRAGVSAVIITFNESENIRRTLSKLQWCDEIIVVDSYSTDGTAAICEASGCKVYYRHFDGYGAQKQFAISKAGCDWVLSLDADEVLTDGLVDEIRSEMQKDSPPEGYMLRIGLVFLGKEFKYGRERGRYHLRLFQRSQGDCNDAPVHEKIALRGRAGRLKGKVLHYSYNTLHQWYAKSDRYTELSAAAAISKGKRKSILSVLLAVPYYFFRYYVLDRNFLNGLQGFYWSACSAQYHFTKYIKIRELYAKQAKGFDVP